MIQILGLMIISLLAITPVGANVADPLRSFHDLRFLTGSDAIFIRPAPTFPVEASLPDSAESFKSSGLAMTTESDEDEDRDGDSDRAWKAFGPLSALQSDGGGDRDDDGKQGDNSEKADDQKPYGSEDKKDPLWNPPESG
jgi:hypothetical protein